MLKNHSHFFLITSLLVSTSLAGKETNSRIKTTLASNAEDDSISQPQMVTGLHLASKKEARSGVKFGFEYAASVLLQKDQGLLGKKPNNEEQKVSRELGHLDAANIMLDSYFGDRNRVHVSYDLINRTIQESFVTRRINNSLDLQIGRIRINQGGNHATQASFYDAFSRSFLVSFLNEGGNISQQDLDAGGDKIGWHGVYSDALALQFQTNRAKVVLQLINAPKIAGPIEGFVRNEEANINISLHAEIALTIGITPIFQYVHYDQNELTTIGTQFTRNKVSGYLETSLLLRRYHQLTPGTNSFDSEFDIPHSTTAFEIHYDMGHIKPFLAYNDFTVNDKKTGGKTGAKIKANTGPINGQGGTTVDNNISTWSVGLELARFTEQFRPRLTISNHSGSWYKEGNSGAEESRSQMDISVAVFGTL